MPLIVLVKAHGILHILHVAALKKTYMHLVVMAFTTALLLIKV
ncbi:MAG: hypothetical protein P8J68_10500 [Arenicellaceae bacterium]|nr:hypothetical protein [Arenicellaceae bacterium]